LTTSVAKDGGSWVWLFAGGFLKQQINITTAKAGAWFVGSVPNPKMLLLLLSYPPRSYP